MSTESETPITNENCFTAKPVDGSYGNEEQSCIHAGLSRELEHKLAAAQQKADDEMLRVKACEHMADGDDGWERLRNECPSTAAVSRLRDMYIAAQQTIAAMQPRRMYPIQGGPSVPYEVMIPHESQCWINHYQSINKIAERGGFSPGEAWMVVTGQKYGGMESKEWWAEVDKKWFEYAERINLHYADLDKAQQTIEARDREIAELKQFIGAHRAAIDAACNGGG